MKKEDIKTSSLILANIPNALTISRIILTFVVVYLIFTKSNLPTIILIFSLAAFTDFLDGKLARKFKWESEFGRRGDMIADRFLWGGTGIAFIVSYGLGGMLNWVHGTQLLLMMLREIISLPFAIIAFFSGTFLPNARQIAKVTTFIQGFALPALIISVHYPVWIYLSLPLSLASGVTGFLSAMHYINDTKQNSMKVK